MIYKAKKIIVHDGTFHADDVLCVAMMQLINPQIKIERLSLKELPKKIDEDTIIADIGFGKYDHHQLDAKRRNDGRKHAACGILLQDLKEILFNGNIPDELIKYICEIEDVDNKYVGATDNFLTTFVRLNNPEWNESQDKYKLDLAFLNTVDKVKINFLNQYIYSENLSQSNIKYFEEQIKLLSKKHYFAEQKAKKIILKAFNDSDGKIVVLPLRLPWYNFLIPTSTFFVINPSNRGGFHLQCVPISVGSNIFKKLLPISWLESAPLGCIFVHNELFLAAFEDSQLAIDAAKKILNDFK